MKKMFTLMLLLTITMVASAQKITIKTGNGKTVEIICEKMPPAEVIVINDSIIFKISETKAETPEIKTNEVEITDSIDTDSLSMSLGDTLKVAQYEDTDSIQSTLVQSERQPTLSLIANAVAEELSPEYAEFNRENEKKSYSSERELIKDVAKNFVSEDVVETVDFFASLFNGIRLTSDTTFTPKYGQRKVNKSIRTYNIIELEGSLGKNISDISDAIAAKVNINDYGDDTKNEHKFGAGLKYSHVYIPGTLTADEWKPNPMGFAWSWGLLANYSYEKDMGSYISAMGKVGIQFGQDIAFGIDGLLGCGLTPYNTFYTNGVNHSTLRKSAFCLKYGLQLWGSLNFYKNTYTAIYGRYILSAKPDGILNELPQGWEVFVEDFDPSSWTIGLAVGYKFGAPKELSTDKRLQASLIGGYQFVGTKGAIVGAEIEHFTQVSYSTNLSYGAAVEELFSQENDKEKYISVLASLGIKVRQPNNHFFWRGKIYAGVGDQCIKFVSNKRAMPLNNFSKKLCLSAAIHLEAGLQLGKSNEIFAALRGGYHLGKSIDVEGFENITYENLRGFDVSSRLGYKLTF